MLWSRFQTSWQRGAHHRPGALAHRGVEVGTVVGDAVGASGGAAAGAAVGAACARKAHQTPEEARQIPQDRDKELADVWYGT